MRKILAICSCLFSIMLQAQNYDVKLIPDSLVKNANVVKRFEEKRLIIYSDSKATLRHKYAITVLNENAADYAEYGNSYSKLRNLSSIDGTLYDASGKKLKEVKSKDIADAPVNDGFSLMQDSRYKYHNFNYSQYPYTVEYEDQNDYYGIVSLPTWMPVGNQKYSVQHSRFVIEAPIDYKVRFKQLNFEEKPVIVTKGKTISYTWEMKNLKPFIYEPFQPEYREVVPSVYVAPTHFSYGGYEGEMDNWLNYGKFQVALNKGKDVLPDDIKQEVHRLIDNVSDKKEKIKILYNYLQQNTRYISIQLGIGGLQPFDAKYVAKNKYGDCKALSNYMTALLKEADITGYYSIINAGENDKYYMPDFPSDQTNHIIVSVPLETDTMWLECTSQTMAAGYLGSFTDDRYALLIKDDGGYLVKTPSYSKNQNLQNRTISGSVNEEGTLVATVKTFYKGLEQDDLELSISSKGKDKVLERMKRSLPIPTYNLANLDYKINKDIIPSIDESYQLTVPHFATISGKRLFISPNLITKQRYKLEKDSARRFEVVNEYAYTQNDTVSIVIPEGYSVEAMPKEVNTTSKFGNYTLGFSFEKNEIKLIRKYECSLGRFPPSNFSQLVDFINLMYKADNSRIVLVKKE